MKHFTLVTVMLASLLAAAQLPQQHGFDTSKNVPQGLAPGHPSFQV
jgi:hypothetical protein